MSRDALLSVVPSVSPSALDSWERCPRAYANRNLYGIAESDTGGTPDLGLLVHAMLKEVHENGSCLDPDHVTEVLALHGIDDGNAVAAMIRRHARRCPSATAVGIHERELARLHRETPMFIAVGRLDAMWKHDGILEVRDYKTGGQHLERVADDPRAQLQAWLAAPLAAARGLRLRVRYEYLAAEVVDDPDPLDADDETLAEITAHLVQTVEAIKDAAAREEFAAAADPEICRTCAYRSICPESAAPGVPSWSVPPEGHQ
ncbi:MAG TPA: PD-(D/E)XK nuclease family protein [Acidimicrobiia bacterium]|jgi:hypothetical protein